MEKITSLTEQLANIATNYPHLESLAFTEGEDFVWNHTSTTVHYNPTADHSDQYLLHEFSHALLNHTTYQRDIDLIKMERDAWHEASELGKQTGVTIDEALVEEALDTYRDWLHDRSLCPTCEATGVQISQTSYRCVACRQEWHVNEARTCALRRYTTKKHPA